VSMQGQWLPDPLHAHELRFWDGTRWTDHVVDAGTQSVDPVPQGAPPPPPPAPDAGGEPPPPPPPAAPLGKGSWKDKIKSAAQSAAQQGKQMAEQAKTKMSEQQAQRVEQYANDPNTLWFGESQSAAGKATGMSKAFYRVTKDRIWIDTGMLGVRSESVPLWAVKDLDVRQSVLQRGKDEGDVVLMLEDPLYGVDPTGMSLTGSPEPGGGTTSGQVILDNVENPYQLRELLLPLISEARSKKLVERQSQYLHVNPGAAMVAAGMAPAAAPPPTPAPAAAPVDVADQLRKLAELRDMGVLTEEEFAAKKTKLLDL
jgi:hypothetical protein